MTVPVGRLVVLRTTAKAELVKAIACLTWPALVAPVVAPTVGGRPVRRRDGRAQQVCRLAAPWSAYSAPRLRFPFSGPDAAVP